MTGSTIHGAALDHVAHAVPRWQDVWDRYAVDFGAEWRSGGLSTGFAPGQVRFGNGAKIEILMPNDVESNDFLHRFITTNGPGPHHLTFKVPDLASALELVEAAGYEPIGIDFRDPEWFEGFIHPREATGVVVQLAQALNDWSSPPPDDYPKDRRRRREENEPIRPASLLSVAHAVADLRVASALFVDLLGGRIVREGSGGGAQWRELTWGGPLDVRLVSPAGTSPTPLHHWLGGRSGRIHHLELATEDPGGLPGARLVTEAFLGGPTGAGPSAYWEIPPEQNCGFRLIAGAG
jgi:catechol 2,3-dioxygenase-like lactoylglutathione lyase family enzyme